MSFNKTSYYMEDLLFIIIATFYFNVTRCWYTVKALCFMSTYIIGLLKVTQWEWIVTMLLKFSTTISVSNLSDEALLSLVSMNSAI